MAVFLESSVELKIMAGIGDLDPNAFQKQSYRDKWFTYQTHPAVQN